MWIKESWNDLSINLDNLSQEMIIGPSNQVAKAIKNVNRRYVTDTYVNGNRSMLEPIKPLGFTRTYRWQPGYKDIVKEVLITRLHQYNKTGSLETMFNRDENMSWNKKNFKRELISIETQLKLLRNQGITTDRDLEVAKQTIDNTFSLFRDKVNEAKLVFDLVPNLEHEFYFEYQTFNRLTDDSLTQAQEDMLKFLTGNVCLNLKYKNPKIPVMNVDKPDIEAYGVVNLEDDLYLSFNMPLYLLFQELQVKSFDQLDHSRLYSGSRYSIEAEIDRYLISNGLSTNRQHFRFVNHISSHYKETNKIKHPFVGSSNGSETLRMFDLELNGKNVCYGNMDNEIRDAFTRLDFVDLARLLDQWQTYCITTTNPLNNISYSLTTLPADQWDERILIDSGQMLIKSMHENVLAINGISDVHKPGPYATDNSWRHLSMSNAVFVEELGYNWDDDEDVYIFGWEFTDKNWIPSIMQLRDVCNPDLNIDTVEAEDICTLQNYLLDSIQASVDMLDADKCITRNYGLYNDMVRVLNSVYGKDSPYKMKGLFKVEEPVEQSNDSSLDEVIDNLNEPFVYAVESDLPFGVDNETTTVQSASEIMTAMEQQLMERG